MNTLTLESYEEIVDYARAISEDLDTKRWDLGDICNIAMERFGEKSIAEIAKDIGQRKSTCYQYAAVCRFYEPNLRRRLKEKLPNIGYSVLRDAMRLKDIDLAVEWLHMASELGYTADEASRQLTLKLGHETRDSYDGLITKRYEGVDGVYVNVFIERGSSWQPGQKVTMKAK